jgi:hypothetical protein
LLLAVAIRAVAAAEAVVDVVVDVVEPATVWRRWAAEDVEAAALERGASTARGDSTEIILAV